MPTYSVFLGPSIPGLGPMDVTMADNKVGLRAGNNIEVATIEVF